QSAPPATGSRVGAGPLLAASVGATALSWVGFGVRWAAAAVGFAVEVGVERVSNTTPPMHPTTRTRPTSPSTVSSVRLMPPRLAGAPVGMGGVLGSEPILAPG